jgi:hypothetical protein
MSYSVANELQCLGNVVMTDAGVDAMTLVSATGTVQFIDDIEFATTKGVYDSAQNEQLLFNATGSAACWFEMTNATAGTGYVTLGAAGAGNTGVALQPLNSGIGLTVLATAGTSAEMRLRELSAGSDYIGLKAPDAITTSMTYILPVAAGTAGQVLSTDGNASTPQTLSWADDTSGGWSYATTGVAVAPMVVNTFYNVSADNVAMTLPTTHSAGDRIAVKNGNFTPTTGTAFTAGAAQQVDQGGAAGVIQMVANKECIVVMSDGTDWWIM